MTGARMERWSQRKSGKQSAAALAERRSVDYYSVSTNNLGHHLLDGEAEGKGEEGSDCCRG